MERRRTLVSFGADTATAAYVALHTRMGYLWQERAKAKKRGESANPYNQLIRSNKVAMGKVKNALKRMDCWPILPNHATHLESLNSRNIDMNDPLDD